MQKDNQTYEGYKHEKGLVTKVADPLTVESALQISINDKPFTVVMQTPGNELELAVGLLYAEDVIKNNTPYQYTTHHNDNAIVDEIHFRIDPNHLGGGYLSARSLLSVSSCGICGKQSLSDLPDYENDHSTGTVPTISTERLFSMQHTFFSAQQQFKVTGGCHGVAAFNQIGNCLTLKEDIGRHNAMDKVVGQLILDKKLKEAQVIMFSGRISYEIVSKAFRAKIKIVMAVSAPSSLAVDFAKEYGITLIAFARNGKATIYANPERIQ